MSFVTKESFKEKYYNMTAHFEQINTLSLKDQIRLLCSRYPIQEQLDALHSLDKELKMVNRARINNVLKGIKVEIRPDEIDLKA